MEKETFWIELPVTISSGYEKFQRSLEFEVKARSVEDAYYIFLNSLNEVLEKHVASLKE